MLINDELTHSAWHLFYTAEGHYLYEDLDSSCGCSTNVGAYGKRFSDIP